MSRQKGKSKVLKTNKVLEKLKIEYVSVESITNNEYNPNRQSPHEFELLVRSMREDGFTQPILVMKSTNTIVDGEHRWMAAKALGITEIPVVYVDMTQEQMRIATLRHNRARGTEDVELTAQVLRDLQKLGALDWAQDSLMLDDVEINKLLEDIPIPEALSGEEFSEAWVPSPDTDEGTDSTVLYKIEGSDLESAVTAEASQAIRVREKLIKEATSEEERLMIKEDSKIHRLALTFTAAQYPTIKKALGLKPAERLLQLCEKAIAEGWIEE